MCRVMALFTGNNLRGPQGLIQFMSLCLCLTNDTDAMKSVWRQQRLREWGVACSVGKEGCMFIFVGRLLSILMVVLQVLLLLLCCCNVWEVYAVLQLG